MICALCALPGICVDFTCAAAPGYREPHLAPLLPPLLQVPFYSATLARARLDKAHARLLTRLKDPVLKADAWPATPTLLLLKLFATVFPASDKRHPVLTPAALLAASCLANCPVTRPRDVAAGLYLSSLLLHLHAPAGRFVPEPLNFAVALLRSAAPASAAAAAAGAAGAGAEEGEQPRWLRLDAAAGAGQEMGAPPATPADIEPLDLVGTLGAGDDDGDSYWSSPDFKTSAAAAAARLVQRTAASLAGLAALPEVMEPALRALRTLAAAAGAAHAAPLSKKQKKKAAKEGAAAAATGAAAAAAAAPAAPGVAPGLAALCAEVAAEVEAGVAAVLASRRPLCNTGLLAIPEARQYNPRYEEQYAAGKDYDPDRCAAHAAHAAACCWALCIPSTGCLDMYFLV